MHHFTLLDGEMVIDTLPDTQKQERRYLVYDMMAINQVSLVEVIYEYLLLFFFNKWGIFKIWCRDDLIIIH